MSKIGIGSYGIGGLGHRDIGLTEKLDDSILYRRTHISA